VIKKVSERISDKISDNISDNVSDEVSDEDQREKGQISRLRAKESNSQIFLPDTIPCST